LDYTQRNADGAQMSENRDPGLDFACAARANGRRAWRCLGDRSGRRFACRAGNDDRHALADAL